MFKKFSYSLLSLSLFLFPLASASYASPLNNHVATMLEPVNNSGVEGFVDLRQRPKDQGTHISLVAFGLQPNQQYLSLYYGNHTCALEPYSADDVIGGFYTSNIVGVGTTHADVEDNLDEINSVSVRTASFQLLACADVHPTK